MTLHRPRILVAQYGHTRVDGEPRNSVILTNYGALRGCQLVGDVVDLSPSIGPGGIDWAAVGGMQYRVEQADVLYCQAGISLEVMQRFREVNPRGLIVLQRDSTHAAEHLALMKAAMQRHGISWEHQYERGGNALLNREQAEYQLADKIFTLSQWVTRSFEAHGLGHKTVQFGSQLAELPLWGPPAYGWAGKGPRFTCVAVGQTGIRKGTFDLLEAWSRFWRAHPESRLLLCGLPEADAAPGLGQALQERYARTPGLETLGWVALKSMRGVYAQSHCMVSASVEEGSMMPGVEAPLCGLPVIATHNSGIDILAHGATGWQVFANDPGALAEALGEAHALFAAGGLEAMGEAARQVALGCGVDDYARNCGVALANVLVERA